MSEVFFVQIVGTNLGKCEWLWEENKMAESKMAKLKMTAIIKLSENEWDWVRLNQFESESEWSESVFEWIWEKVTSHLKSRWQCQNPTWQNSRWLPSSSWVRMNEWSFFCAKWLNPWWQNSRWLPSSNWVRMNEFESDWISLSQSFFAKWLNPRWQNSRWKNSRWLPSLS